MSFILWSSFFFFFLATQHMFELIISATGWDDTGYKTKQAPRIPGECGFWISTLYTEFLTHAASEMRPWHCWLCHDDKFALQLAFFSDVINEISVHLQPTGITFPWIQGKTREDTSRKYLNVHSSPFSLCRENQPMPPKIDSWLDEKWLWTESLQRQVSDLSEIRCFSQHCSAYPICREVAAAPRAEGFLQPLLRLCKAATICLKSFPSSLCYPLQVAPIGFIWSNPYCSFNTDGWGTDWRCNPRWGRLSDTQSSLRQPAVRMSTTCFFHFSLITSFLVLAPDCSQTSVPSFRYEKNSQPSSWITMMHTGITEVTSVLNGEKK